MSESLGQKQRRFAKWVPRLIDKAHELGFEVTLGDVYRDPKVFGAPGVKMGYGNAYSCHKFRLAIDLNLFKNGVYITDDQGHKLLGPWWESLAPDHCWGGRFQDPNHYSVTHEGVK